MATKLLNLPAPVIDALRDRFLAAVGDAQAGFEDARADEDSLTGALGQELSRRPLMTVFDGMSMYALKTNWKKVRGRGPGAPENLYGLDGIFQLEVLDEFGNVIVKKGLPFQAKTEWKGSNPDLAKQCGIIDGTLGGGIVVNFTGHGYEACSTKVAVAFGGSYPKVEKAKKIRPLGQMLANEFLNCTVGTVGLFFDPASERFIGQDGNQMEPRTTITTVVQRVLWPPDA